MQSTEEIILRINNRAAVVAVVGVGYVGLPLALAMHRAGHSVLAVDTDPTKIELLNSGKSYLRHLGEDPISEMCSSDRFDATDDFARLGNADVILVCVPTPLAEDRTPDLRYVLSTARSIGMNLRGGQLVVLESTTYPGTTREEFLPEIRRAIPGPALEFFLAYSPERENPGSSSHTTSTTPKLVAGLNADSLRVARALYETAIEQVVPVGSLEIAESAKLLENVFRAVNIALVNELKVVLSEMGIDIWQVVRAAATKPFGYMPFYPGPGLGGHCIPIDPFYLAWKAREVGHPSRFIELAGEINTEMPGHVIDLLGSALNERGGGLEGSRILVIGLAYKPDVDDIRESPSFELIRLLQEGGALVDYHDPHVPRTKRMRKYDFKLESISLTQENIRVFDAVIISTDHSTIDYTMLAEYAQLVIDTRDAMRPYASQMEGRLVRA